MPTVTWIGVASLVTVVVSGPVELWNLSECEKCQQLQGSWASGARSSYLSWLLDLRSLLELEVSAVTRIVGVRVAIFVRNCHRF